MKEGARGVPSQNDSGSGEMPTSPHPRLHVLAIIHTRNGETASNTFHGNSMLDSGPTMTSNAAMEVAHLRFQHLDHPNGNGKRFHVSFDCRLILTAGRFCVFPNAQFDIGREDVRSLWGVTDMTISTHHLRFWCVMYESDSEDQVAPMVYVRVLSANNVHLSTSLRKDRSTTDVLSNTTPDILLNHGDVLHLSEKITVRFQTHSCYAVQSGNLTGEQMMELEHFDHQYEVTDRRLGIGAFGSVFVAVKQSNRRQVACKIIGASTALQSEVTCIDNGSHALPPYSETQVKDRRDRSREFMVLKDLCHPNIITLEKVICTTKHTYIFQELITGGDLLSYLDKSGPLGEAECAVIARQVVKAVDYLHDNGVVHRDIKPENILMTSWREGSRIVLTDFGQARTFEETKASVRKSAALRMHSMVGTYGYTAPEVLNMEQREMRERGYSKAVDIWSIGCITATLMTNQSLFPDEAKDAEDRQILRSRRASQRWGLAVMDEGMAWQSIGRKAKSFIRGCLRLDETMRLTAKQALLHEWFTNKHYADDIEAAYQRAIQDWVPRDADDHVVQVIDTSTALQAAESLRPESYYPRGQVKSQYFVQPSQYSLPPPPSLFYNTASYPTQFSI